MLADPLLKGRGPMNLISRPSSMSRNRARVVRRTLCFLMNKANYCPKRAPAALYKPVRNVNSAPTGCVARRIGGSDRAGIRVCGHLSLNDTRRLLEVVCLPVEQAGGGRKVGTFIMGFPVSRRGEQTWMVSELATGVWVDGALLSEPAAELDQPKVADWLRAHAEDVAQDDNAEALFIQMHGMPYQCVRGSDGFGSSPA